MLAAAGLYTEDLSITGPGPEPSELMQNRCPMSTISPWSSTAMTRRGVAMTCRIRTDRACAKMVRCPINFNIVLSACTRYALGWK